MLFVKLQLLLWIGCKPASDTISTSSSFTFVTLLFGLNHRKIRFYDVHYVPQQVGRSTMRYDCWCKANKLHAVDKYMDQAPSLQYKSRKKTDFTRVYTVSRTRLPASTTNHLTCKRMHTRLETNTRHRVLQKPR